MLASFSGWCMVICGETQVDGLVADGGVGMDLLHAPVTGVELLAQVGGDRVAGL